MADKKISQVQLISIGICYLLGTLVVSAYISATAGNESPLIGFFGFVFFLPVLFIYFSLTKKYPGKGLFEINEAVFGAAFGRILSFFYLLFFFSICTLNIADAGNFLYDFIMPDTPLFVITLFMMLACMYCVKKGIIAIARVSTVFLLVTSIGLGASFIFSLSDANFEFLLPLFHLKPIDYIQSTHIATAIPYGESIFLLMLVPKLSDKVSIKKGYLTIAVITAITMCLTHLREVIALGPMAAFTTFPSFEAMRMISIANIFTRLESVFACLIVSLTFFKILLLFYVCLKGITQIFRLSSYRHIILMLGILLTVYATRAYDSPSSNAFWGKNVFPFILTFFTAILPLGTLLTSLIRGRHASAKGRVKSG